MKNVTLYEHKMYITKGMIQIHLKILCQIYKGNKLVTIKPPYVGDMGENSRISTLMLFIMQLSFSVVKVGECHNSNHKVLL